jgi:hypothetical protein
MKARNGFVSNSSSSSFLINTFYLSDFQIESIKNYKEVASKNKMECCSIDYCSWTIKIIERIDGYDDISGFTLMDNFDMHYFLTRILGIDREHIKWD